MLGCCVCVDEEGQKQMHTQRHRDTETQTQTLTHLQLLVVIENGVVFDLEVAEGVARFIQLLLQSRRHRIIGFAVRSPARRRLRTENANRTCSEVCMCE